MQPRCSHWTVRLHQLLKSILVSLSRISREVFVAARTSLANNAHLKCSSESRHSSDHNGSPRKSVVCAQCVVELNSDVTYHIIDVFDPLDPQPQEETSVGNMPVGQVVDMSPQQRALQRVSPPPVVQARQVQVGGQRRRVGQQLVQDCLWVVRCCC